jgi:hypothetical protein
MNCSVEILTTGMVRSEREALRSSPRTLGVAVAIDGSDHDVILQQAFDGALVDRSGAAGASIMRIIFECERCQYVVRDMKLGGTPSAF